MSLQLLRATKDNIGLELEDMVVRVLKFVTRAVRP